MYLGVVIGALGVDYYPRLAEIGQDRAAIKQSVNEHTSVSDRKSDG
jgi:hypothetical protein